MTQEIWLHFTQEQLLEYHKRLDNPDSAAGYLAEVLGLPDYRFDARQAIRLDYASYVLEFAKEQVYGPVRTASLFQVAQSVMETCTSDAPFPECEERFKSLMLSRVSPRPGSDTAQFSPDQVSKFAAFMARGLFRHYKLYQFVFTREQGHAQYSAQLLVETPIIQPFAGALSQADWDAYHAQQRGAAEAARQAAEEAQALRQAEEAQAAEAARRAADEERRKEELARKPATLEQAIEHLVAVRLEAEKELMAADYKSREGTLLAKITALEEAKAAKPPAGAGAAKK